MRIYIGTLRNFDPIKNYNFFQPKDSPERPLIVPLEALEPCEEYHGYHLEGSVTNRAFTNRINFNNERPKTELEHELCNTESIHYRHSITRSNELTCIFPIER